jgi:hypothetical protein
MKKILFLTSLFVTVLLQSCTDNCTQTRRYRRFTPVTLTLSELRQPILTAAARELKNPGKIYVKGNYVFINEIKEGIHVFDNSNPSAPKAVAFWPIPGNGDMAIRNNVLYADSYTDLVALDITNPLIIKELSRQKEVFVSGQFDGMWWSYNTSIGAINDQKAEYVTETVKVNCEDGQMVSPIWAGGVMFDSKAMSSAASGTAGAAPNGQGGSMARFTLYDNYLYTVSNSDLQLFDIKTPEKPAKGNKINLGWGIETIFPYKDKLFIGSQTGMFIFDNVNPSKPVQMSVFQHAFACDPVVVHENRAYVTLRSGTNCRRTDLNQLDVVDITNLRSPQLLKSHQMQNPAGLGVVYPYLFLCEGKFGLKSLDISNDFSIKLLQHIQDLDAYDVIAISDKILLMIGKDGLYQFDYSNPNNLKQLSKIPVAPKEAL